MRAPYANLQATTSGKPARVRNSGDDVQISEGDIRHLEALAALRLSDADRERMREHLRRILEYMQSLNSIDVTDVPPTSHVLDSRNILREDQVTPSLASEEALHNAPASKGRFYRVPRFVGE